MFSSFNFFGSSFDVNIRHYFCLVLCTLVLIKSRTKSRSESGVNESLLSISVYFVSYQ